MAWDASLPPCGEVMYPSAYVTISRSANCHHAAKTWAAWPRTAAVSCSGSEMVCHCCTACLPLASHAVWESWTPLIM